MTVQLATDLLLAGIAVRVFGRDALVLLRRIAAVGVRAGVNELRRSGREEGGR